VVTCSKSGVPRRGNCVDRNARSEYVVQSCHRCQQSEAENEREQRRSNRCRGSTLVIGHGYSRCHQRNFALRHGQPVKSVVQCWRDVVISPDAVISRAAA